MYRQDLTKNHRDFAEITERDAPIPFRSGTKGPNVWGSLNPEDTKAKRANATELHSPIRGK
jgi:hypothetical protein